MAQAIWADEFARSVPDSEEADELWHVRLSSDEVKVLPLEKLDDLFRLSIVDESTLVWQQGMSNWQPLGAVAGIEPEPPTPVVPWPKPPAPVRPLAVQHEPSVIITPAMLESAPPSSGRMVSVSDIEPLSEGRSIGRYVIALAAIAGLFVTLYRNGVLASAARSAALDGQYSRLEQSLGGPSFGTLRAIEAGSPAAVSAAPALAAPAVASGRPSAVPEPESAPAPAPAPALLPAVSATEPVKKDAPAVVSLDSLPLEQQMSAALSGARAPARVKAPARKASPTLSPSTTTKKPSKRRRGGASDYDPLNGNL